MKTDEELLVCEACFKGDEHKFKPKNFNFIPAKKVDFDNLLKKDPDLIKQYTKDQELDEMIDNYYKLDFEDIITGGIKTRFKYTKVAPNSYGLTDEEIMYTEDKLLNQFVSMKKLAPYRPDEGMIDMGKSKRKRQIVRKTADTIKKVFHKEIKKDKEFSEKLKKMSGAKAHKLELLRKNKKTKLDYMLDPYKTKAKTDLVIEQAPMEIEYDIPQAKELPGISKKITSSRLKSYGVQKD